MARQKLRTVLEGVVADKLLSHIGGEVRDADELLRSGALERLDENYGGIYALFLFHAIADADVYSYLSTGAIASDSGNQIFALYEQRPRERSEQRLSKGFSDTVVISQENAFVSFGRSLFPDAHLQLPGIVFMDRLSAVQDCIYLPLAASPRWTMTQRIRQILSIAGRAASTNKDTRDFGRLLGTALAMADCPYIKNSNVSTQEHFAVLLRSLWNSRRDLAAMIPVVGKTFQRKDN